ASNGFGIPGGGGGSGNSAMKSKSPSKKPSSPVLSRTLRRKMGIKTFARPLSVRPRNARPPRPSENFVSGENPKKPHGGGPPAGLGPTSGKGGVDEPAQFASDRRSWGPNRPSFLAVTNT